MSAVAAVPSIAELGAPPTWRTIEFISDLHTPKNVLIVGTKSKRGKDAAALRKLADAKAFFGIRRHYLEEAVGLTAG